MATGSEDYVLTMTSDPTGSLTKARTHLMELMKLQGVRTSDTGVSYDPSTLETAIQATRDDIATLERAVNRRGLPYTVPMYRVD